MVKKRVDEHGSSIGGFANVVARKSKEHGWKIVAILAIVVLIATYA